MTVAENKYWNQTAHDNPFVMPYAGFLVVNEFGGESLSLEEQRLAAAVLTDSVGTGIHSVEIDADSAAPFVTFKANLVAESDLDAVRRLSANIIEAWCASGRTPDNLEFVEAHLAFQPLLEADRLQDPSADIKDAHYTVEILELPRLDDFGEPMTTEARLMFLEARDAACQN